MQEPNRFTFKSVQSNFPFQSLLTPYHCSPHERTQLDSYRCAQLQTSRFKLCCRKLWKPVYEAGHGSTPPLHTDCSYCQHFTHRLQLLPALYTQTVVTASTLHTDCSYCQHLIYTRTAVTASTLHTDCSCCQHFTYRLQLLPALYTRTAVTASTLHTDCSYCQHFTHRL